MKSIITLIFLLTSQMVLAVASSSLELSGAEYVPLLDIAGRSCKAQVTDYFNDDNDLEPVKAIIGTMRLSWFGNEDVTLEKMAFYFSGKRIENGAQVVSLSKEELSHLWGGYGENIVLKAHSRLTTTPFCQFSIGGIKILNKYEYFETSATVKVTVSYMKNDQKVYLHDELVFRYHLTPLRRR